MFYRSDNANPIALDTPDIEPTTQKSEPQDFPDIVAGAGHSCLLTTTGRIECWGGNQYGQLGGKNGPFTLLENGPPFSGIPGVVLGLLYWLDTVYINWHRRAFQTFNTEPFFYFMIALLILFAILIIFLTWFLLVYSKSSWVTVIFCLLTGIGILIISRPFNIPILNHPALSGLFYVIYSLEAESVTLQAGAFVFVIGLIDLVRKIRTKSSPVMEQNDDLGCLK